MKKVLILVMTVFFLFVFTACGNTTLKNNESETDYSNTNSSFDETLDEDTSSEELILENDGKYVIVAMNGKSVSISSESDFSKYSIGYIDETDGMRYAEYYDFKDVGMYNSVHDLHLSVKNNSFDLAIVTESEAEAYDDWVVVWQMQ